jgi:Ca2+-binding EF-hand superfamily protein
MLLSFVYMGKKMRIKISVLTVFIAIFGILNLNADEMFVVEGENKKEDKRERDFDRRKDEGKKDQERKEGDHDRRKAGGFDLDAITKKKMAHMDKDKDGTVSKDEFVNRPMHGRGGKELPKDIVEKKKKALAEMFTKTDTNNDGFISHEEMLAVTKSIMDERKRRMQEKGYEQKDRRRKERK